MNNEMERESTKSEASSCPLVSPLFGRVPAILAILAAFGTAFTHPLFLGIAGALLATISLLVSPAGGRALGMVGLLAAIGGGLLGTGHFL
jgi:hypothetical protein